MSIETLDEMRTYSVVSMLASAKLATRLPIRDLLCEEPFNRVAEYADLPRLAFRVGSGRQHVTVFPNGTATVRGCSSVEEAAQVLTHVRDMVGSVIPMPQGPVRPIIQNIVATHNLGRSVDLRRLQERLPSEDISYEPEQFPGLILRFAKERTVALIFANGKMVVTGTRSYSHLEQILANTHRLLAAAGV